MPNVTRARLGVGFGALLAIIAAAVAGVILFASGRAGEVDLTTADFVPADAGVYIALNTDLASPSWVSAFDLVRRLGNDDPEAALQDATGEADLSWEDDITPFLGGNAAVYLRGLEVDALSFEGGVVVKCRDCAQAVMVIRREAGDNFESKTYRDFKYLAGDLLYISASGEHLFLAPTETSLFEMLDLAAGEGESLASTADFKRLRDELSPNFIGFVYLSASNLTVQDMMESEGVIRTAFEEAGVGDIVLQPIAMAFGAKSNGFEAQAAAVGEAGASASLLQPHESRFASMVPPETAIFLHTTGLAAAWDAALAEAGPEIDDAIRMTTEFDSLDEALRDAGAAVGLASVADVLDQLTGEAAFAAWFPDGAQGPPAVAFLAEVENPAESLGILRSLAEGASGQPPGMRTVAGTAVLTVDSGLGEVWFGAGADYLLFGTPEAVTAVLGLEGEGLAGTTAFRNTLDGLSAPTGTFVYVDLPALLEMVPGGQLVSGIGPAVLNMVMVPEQGLARLLAFVSVPE